MKAHSSHTHSRFERITAKQTSARIATGLVVAFTLSAGCLPVKASTVAWSNTTATTASWNDALNWNGTLPSSTDEANFPTNPASSLTISLDASQVIQTLSFTGDTNTAFTIGTDADVAAGNTLTLTNVTRGNVAKVQTIVANVILGGNSTWDIAAGQGDYMQVNGQISGDGLSLTKTNTGTLVLAGTSTYSGGTFVNAGQLTLSGTNNLNTAGNITIAGGTLTLSGYQSTSGVVTLTSGALKTGTLELTGADISVQAGNISTVLTGAAGLVKTGNGSVTLYGANTYTGTTQVLEGTLTLATAGKITSSITVGSLTGTTSARFTASGSSTLVTYTTLTVYQNGSASLGNAVHAYNVTINGGNVTSSNAYIDGSIVMTGGTLAGTFYGNHGSITAYASDSTAVISGANKTNKLNVFTVYDGASDVDLQVTGGIANNSGGYGITLAAASTGVMSLEASNSYTGATSINGGTLRVFKIVNGGSSSGIGSSGTAASNLVLAGGTLQYMGDTTSTDRYFTVASNSTIEASGSGAITFTGAPKFSSSTAATRLTLSGTNTGDNTLAGVIADGSKAAAITKSGIGKWVLSGANTYTGSTIINGGILSVSSLANGGSSSGIGASTNTASNLVFNGGTLQYTGDTTTTDRNFTVTADSALDASGIGAVTFTGAPTFSGASATTFGLKGSSTADNTFAGAINNGTQTTSLNKSGTGKWVLTGSNGYTGTTSVDAGTLAIGSTGSIDHSSQINIASTGTLDVAAKSGFTVGSGQVLTNRGAITGSVAVSGTLNGSGSISGDLVINSNGVRGLDSAPGIQEVGGNLTLLDNSTFAMQLRKDSTTASAALVAGTDYDQIVVSGQVTLGGTLALQLGGTLLTTDSFVLFLNSSDTLGLSGSFSSITVNGVSMTDFTNNTFTYNDQQYALVTTNADNGSIANDLELVAVPEPGTWGMLLGGLGLLAFGQRFRRRA